MNAQNAQPPHAVSVVLNSISHDARVLKEAHALAGAGYRVTIVGIMDNNCSEALTVYPSGTRAERVECRDKVAQSIAHYRKLRKRTRRPVIIGGCVVLFLILPELIGLVTRFVNASTLNERIALMVLGVIVGFGIDGWLRRRKPAAKGGAGKGGQVSLLERMSRATRNSMRRRVYCNALTAKVLELKPDVLHMHDVTTLPIGLLYRKQGGKAKLIFDSHELFEDIPHASKLHRRRARRLQERIAPMLSGFITINESIADKLVGRYPKMPKPVLIMNAARCPDAPAVDDGRLRAAAGVDAGQKILLYQGGFAVHRGLDKLVESARLLPEDWTLVMMGWGRYEEGLKRKADQIDPDRERVRFIGRAPQEELVHWTAGADLGVIPYVNIGLNHWFCTPNKLWEYPAAGVPILASPFPELRRIVEGQQVGVLLDDPVTPDGIARAVGSISDQQLAQLKENCRAFIERDHWGVYADRLLGLYEQVVK